MAASGWHQRLKPGESKSYVAGDATEEGRTPLAFEALSPDGQWVARGFVRADADGHLAVYRLEVFPADVYTVGVGDGLSSDDLRALPLGRWLEQTLATLTDEALLAQTGAGYDAILSEMGYEQPSAERKAWAHALAEEARSVRLRRGRRGYPEDHYRRIALAYLELQRQGVGRGIQQRLAEQEDRPWQTIRDWIHGATERGFLTPGKPGRAGRLPGPRLYEGAPPDTDPPTTST